MSGENSDNEVLQISTMVDTIEVPFMEEYSHKYPSWVGGKHLNHCISNND